MLLTILRHTPTWVWGLLATLVALGLLQTRARDVTRARLLALPLAMLLMSLWSLAPAFASTAWAPGSWGIGFAAALAATARLRPPPGARWRAETLRWHLPGSWAPMALILAIFSLKYGVGVALGLQPSWRTDAGFQLAIAALYGILNAALLGRSLSVLRLAPRPGPLTPQAMAAQP